MSRLKKLTKKLFYDKYVYKISVWTDLASEFRGNDISATVGYLQRVHDDMIHKGESERSWGNRWNTKKVTLRQVQRNIALGHLLSSLESYHIRVEGSILSVYTNEETVLDTVSDLYNEQYELREIWRPENDKIKEFLLANPRKILRPEYSHKYKVTVNSIPDVTAFKDWAAKLPKLKVMPRNNYVIGGYFYVADEKTLSLCRIFLGDRIRRIDELRTVSEI